MYFADLAAAHDLRGALEMRAGALLQAYLHDALVGARSLHHKAPFAHHVGHGLLHIDVLMRLAGRHHDVGMPVIRRGDHHGGYRTVVQELAKVGVSAGLTFGQLVGGLQIRLIDVADGDDFGIGLLLEVGQIHTAHAATADDADADSIACGGAGCLGQGTCSGGAGQRRTFEEVSTIHGRSLPGVDSILLLRRLRLRRLLIVGRQFLAVELDYCVGRELPVKPGNPLRSCSTSCRRAYERWAISGRKNSLSPILMKS